MKSNVTVVGLQWGDEGKGKVVDALASRCRYVARYCGGANAGHSVNVSGQRYALHLIPSGILNAGVHNVIGNGVAFDPVAGLEEIRLLRGRGVHVDSDNLHISGSAHVVMPYHKLGDRLAEENAPPERRIGTTGRGIGPCYADKANRSMGIRVCDLLDADRLRERLREILAVKNVVFAALYGVAPLDAEAIWREYAEYGRELAGMVTDTGAMLRGAFARGESICFEGGQGSLLDVDHGTYPFVTSSSVTACGVPAGAGVPPKAVGLVLGVVKSYTSRVGAGPFPTELTDATGDAIRQRGREFGTTTGRPRRCGWFDAVAVRYTAALSGVDELAMMLLLDGPPEIPVFRVCTAYRYRGREVREFDPALPLEQVECVYEDLPAWTSPIASARRFEELPEAARRYVERIEQLVGRPITILSVGLRREQTIVRNSKLDLE